MMSFYDFEINCDPSSILIGEYKEQYDITTLIYLIENNYIIEARNSKKFDGGFNYDSDRHFCECLLDATDIILKGHHVAKFNYAYAWREAGLGCGRVCAKRGLSVSNIRRDIRHLICKDYYTDVDVKNAHPSALIQICEYNNIDMPNLKNYVEDRSTYLKMIMNGFGVCRDLAKQLFISMMYGGKYTTWIKKNNVKCDDETIIDTLKNFQNEFEKVMIIVRDKNPAFFQHALKIKKTEQEAMRTTLAMFNQSVERLILTEMIKSFQDQGLIKQEKGVWDCIPCYDGVMVPCAVSQKNLHKCEASVFVALNLTIELTIKDMDEWLDVPIYYSSKVCKYIDNLPTPPIELTTLPEMENTEKPQKPQKDFGDRPKRPLRGNMDKNEWQSALENWRDELEDWTATRDDYNQAIEEWKTACKDHKQALKDFKEELEAIKKENSNIMSDHKRVFNVKRYDYLMTYMRKYIVYSNAQTNYFMLNNNKWEQLNINPIKSRLSNTKFDINNIRYAIDVGGRRKITAFDFYDEHINKREVDEVVFEPRKSVPQRHLNTFTGYDVEHSPPPVGWESEDISQFYDIILSLTNDNQEHADWLLNHLARIIQKPYERSDICVVIQSEQGVGKDSILSLIEAIIGKAYVFRTNTMDSLFGDWSNMDKRLFVVINELEAKQGYSYADKFKDSITADEVEVREKYVSAYKVKNFVNFFGFTNNIGATKIEDSDRRFVVFQASTRNIKNIHPEKKAYWDLFLKKRTDPKYVYKVFDELMKRDVVGFDPRDRPITNAYEEAKILSIHPVKFAIKDMLLTEVDGLNSLTLERTHDEEKRNEQITIFKNGFSTSHLVVLMKDYLKKYMNDETADKINSRRLGKMLSNNRVEGLEKRKAHGIMVWSFDYDTIMKGLEHLDI